MIPTERTQKLASIPLQEVSDYRDWLRTCFQEELAERLAVREGGSFYEDENIYHCALLLHLVSDLDDLPSLYSAKFYSAKCSGDMDLGCGFDWQFLFMCEPETLKESAKSIGRGDIVQRAEAYEEDYRNKDMEAWLNGVIRYYRRA